MLDTLYLLDRTLSHPTLDTSPSTACGGTVPSSATTPSSLPSYLQVIQLVEVPAPSPAQLKGSGKEPEEEEEEELSSSSYESSSYASSSYSSTLSSTSSSMDTESESYCSYCSTSFEENESGGMSSGSPDAECDRVRLNRISAWTTQVLKNTTHRERAVIDETDPHPVLNGWRCSACDRGFKDSGSLSAHGTSEPCRAAVEYALSSQ